MFKFIPAIILAIISGLCLLAARPTPGGVDANAIMVLPAAAIGLLSVVAALVAWLL